MPRPPRSNGAETRERILDVAQELFTQNGYDKTSLRDIAERLDITKAALYYYFERKEEILLELHLRLHNAGTEMLNDLEAIPDGPERVAAWPALLDGFIDVMFEHRDLLLLHRRNQGAMNALHNNEQNRIENEELEARLTKILSSSAIPLDARVRMAAAIGVVTEVLAESGFAFDNDPSEQLTTTVRQIVAEVLQVSTDIASTPG